MASVCFANSHGYIAYASLYVASIIIMTFEFRQTINSLNDAKYCLFC